MNRTSTILTLVLCGIIFINLSPPDRIRLQWELIETTNYVQKQFQLPSYKLKAKFSNEIKSLDDQMVNIQGYLYLIGPDSLQDWILLQEPAWFNEPSRTIFLKFKSPPIYLEDQNLITVQGWLGLNKETLYLNNLSERSQIFLIEDARIILDQEPTGSIRLEWDQMATTSYVLKKSRHSTETTTFLKAKFSKELKKLDDQQVYIQGFLYSIGPDSLQDWALRKEPIWEMIDSDPNHIILLRFKSPPAINQEGNFITVQGSLHLHYRNKYQHPFQIDDAIIINP